MRQTAADTLRDSMEPGRVYRRSELEGLSNNLSRDLKKLVKREELVRAGAGLYYRPEETRYGVVSPKNEELVRNFLRDDDFLLLDPNQYNSLVGGLTQLSMGPKVLNRRRNGYFKLAGFPFKFQTKRNFPRELTKPFLLVDLLDSVEETEDGTPLRERVLSRLEEYNAEELLENAKRYGKRSTQRFLEETLSEQVGLSD